MSKCKHKFIPVAWENKMGVHPVDNGNVGSNTPYVESTEVTQMQCVHCTAYALRASPTSTDRKLFYFYDDSERGKEKS